MRGGDILETMSVCVCPHLQYGGLVRVSLHLFLNGLSLLVILCPGEESAIEHRPTVLEEHLDELELVVA